MGAAVAGVLKNGHNKYTHNHIRKVVLKTRTLVFILGAGVTTVGMETEHGAIQNGPSITPHTLAALFKILTNPLLPCPKIKYVTDDVIR